MKQQILRLVWVNGRDEESRAHYSYTLTGQAVCGQYLGGVVEERLHIVPPEYGKTCQVCKEIVFAPTS